MMELRGVTALNDQAGEVALIKQLRVVLGDTKIVVEEDKQRLHYAEHQNINHQSNF